MKSKQDIRKKIAAKRKALDPRWVEAASTRIVGNLLAQDVFLSAKTVALYMAIDGEVNLAPLFPECWNMGKRTCIPIFNAESKAYEMALVSGTTSYRTGHYGIKEPVAPSLVPMDQVDLVAVPGVAFDRNGNRLGRGGGYYDRLMEGFPGFSVAVAFDFQLLPRIPCEAHDKPVDALVTETGIVNVL